MSKKIAFGTKPAKGTPASLDELVASRREGQGSAAAEAPAEPTKRVSVDLPLSLHTKLKIYCVQNQILQADLLLELVKAKFSET